MVQTPKAVNIPYHNTSMRHMCIFHAISVDFDQEHRWRHADKFFGGNFVLVVVLRWRWETGIDGRVEEGNFTGKFILPPFGRFLSYSRATKFISNIG
nr:hypothetical protein [Chitinophaga sp. XS-30]